MQNNFKFKRLSLWQKKYRKFVNFVAVVVVFVTTYALILPALTLDQDKVNQTSGINTGLEQLPSDSSSILETSTEAGIKAVVEPHQTEASTQVESPVSVSADESSKNIFDQERITEPTTMVYSSHDYELTAEFDATAQFPKGVELIVRELDSQSEEYQAHYEKTKENLGVKNLVYARFFDIHFSYRGQEVEPAAPVKIKIINKELVRRPDDSKLKIVHFEENSQIEFLEAETKENEQQISEISFDASHFSVYGDVLANYYTVKFTYIDTAGQEQIITSLIDKTVGTTLGSLPEAPFKNGYVFSHWINKATGERIDENTVITGDLTAEAVFNNINIYTIDVTYFYHNVSKNQDITIDKETVQLEVSDTPYQLTPPASTEVSNKEDPSLPAVAIYYPEKPILEFTGDKLEELDLADGVDDNRISERVKFVPYNAEYEVVYKLKNLTGSGYSDIQTVPTRGVLGSTVTPQILTYSYADFERVDTQKIDSASGQKMYVYYTRKNFTLSYNSNGGSNVSQQSGLYDSRIKISTTTPTKEGYTFEGWYDNPDLTGSKITNFLTLKKDTTLYAKWTPNSVAYTVVYYKQQYDNATGTIKWVYDSAKEATAKVGTTVSATNAPTIPTNLPYHEVDATENATSTVEIAADGSSILPVYYKLKRYTFVFNLNGPAYWDTGRIRINNVTYNLSNYTIPNVVLGQDISSLWPSSSEEVYDEYGNYFFDYWRESRSKTKRFEVTPDLLNLASENNLIFQTAVWINSGTRASVEYWLQSADDPNLYVLSNKYSQSFIRTGGLTAKEIFGYTYQGNYTPPGYQASQTRGNPYVYRFYYNRTNYKIDYYFNGSRLRTIERLPFERNINDSTYNYIPERPNNVDPDYTWGGWYADADLTAPYSFSTMPANNLVLYAKWIAPKFKITFDINGGNGTSPPDQSVEKYKYAKAPADPTREHYNFLGWYTEDGKLYSWSDQVTKDVKLTAKWELKPLTYTVRYLEAGTNTQLAADKVITSPALVLNQVITEKALGITGYRPDKSSQSINLNFSENEITFYYSPKVKEVVYTVKYVLKDNPAIEVAPTVTRKVDGSIIRAKETAADVNKQHLQSQSGVTAEMLEMDYYPTVNTQSLILTSNDANNVIVFEYVGFDTQTFTVNYLDMDGKKIDGQEPLVVYRKKPGSFVVDHKTINGYTYDHSLDSENAADKTVYRVSKGGHITIDLYYKKNLALTALDKSKVYDGTALSSSGLSDLNPSYSSELKTGDKLVAISYDGSQTNAGSSATTPKLANISNASGADRTNFYHITYQAGNLRVDQQPVVVVINGEKKSKIYDGKAEAVGYKVMEIRDTSGLYKETDIHFNGSSSEQSVKKKDAGIYPLLLNNRFTNTNQNFQVDFLISDGELRIDRRQLTITSDSASKDYDGSELRADNITISAPTGVGYSGFVEGEGLVPTFLGGPTEPGFMPNYFTYQPKDGTNLANYELDIQFGQLKVKEVIKIQKTDLTWKALSGGKFELTKWDGLNWAQVNGAQEFAITSTDGSNIPVGLEPGRYRLQELAAPDGFIVLDSYIYFSIKEIFNEDKTSSFYTVSLSDEAGKDASPERATLTKVSGDASHRIQVANEQGKALPSTGGDGQKWFILSGLVLIAISYLMHLFVQRRR
ncbi:InlB B-repeat-containing protein [Streptococcus suis]|uniref:InlB B-repeat-containing protein n=1 Tax=Streptococcus suis TaxID=1307 RepID=UPI00041A9594|nr:InlB B-repeat-containing protein [Streptococcus suis]MDN2969774.1 InlB B-repeat-containing protein [Streptococcus suis]MDN2977337.1 InlB B-repeat-containing protein [Streptococcus suis]MDS1161205.1 InlB B-repeat-containing protein [Streptococcus suis]MDW8656506.1 InlB B-repeat-containing protein [Streptococcus suis]MDW8690694.1 InlB B-repeat-containing protein [Streptococcus suis]